MASYLITDTTVFTGKEVIEASVLIENGIITYVGSQPPVTNHQIISKPGYTLIPGLIDAHVHIIGDHDQALQQALKFGVTTVLEMGNSSYEFVEEVRKACQSPDMADYRSACIPGTVPGGHPEPMLRAADPHAETYLSTWPRLNSVNDVDNFIETSVQNGADYIKILQESGKSMGINLPSPSEDIQTAVVNAAHKQGLKVIGHALSFEDTMVLLRAGVDGTAHIFYDQIATEELISAHKAWCCPTLVTVSSLTGNIPETDSRMDLKEEVLQIFCKCINQKGAGCTLENAFKNVKALKQSGVDIICGTDAAAVTPGTAMGASLHQEFWMYVEHCGFTPLEALSSATSMTARCFGLDRGSIEVGKRADLVLIEGPVTKDIRQSMNVRLVWKAGVMKVVE